MTVKNKQQSLYNGAFLLFWPLPWQKAQTDLTPGRVLQSMGPLFAQLGSPTCPVKQRGKSPGWSKDRKRSPPPRFKVVKRNKKRARSARLTA